MSQYSINTIVCTIFALVAFAGNSVLCRLALGEDTIDAASFTIIRLLSGIITLLLVIFIVRKKHTSKTCLPLCYGNWSAAVLLFIYALAFSYGYNTLDTGTGALILFGAVQITMIIISVFKGNRLHLSEWLGLGVAFSGFVYLMLPSITTPSVMGFILMTISGAAWGVYTLVGRGSKHPLFDTAFNFLRTVPLLIVLIFFTFDDFSVTSNGVLFAVLSGALASGLGYAVWYVALRELTVTQAAVVQLFVPVIATLGGVIFTREVLTLQLIEASGLILGGIFMVILGRRYFVTPLKN
ncbi:DMT family transporter [Thalassotalea castellviae]|uniref:DMT family transporter n=1 Tax=Thalassotalea castellviae TaxID=3075612 RepID=A0ABU3A3M9_9GAMM|nr:DMT family transporter [Thalassotalea sp. W431]MDT0604782.1 DMT family transporter [Thalassotalea sp. W431]